MRIVRDLKSKGVFVATNIIIDYGDCENKFGAVYELFDYVTWNPYWDGDWNAEKAQERWDFYFDKFTPYYRKTLAS